MSVARRKHNNPRNGRPLFSHKRFQFAGAIVIGSLIPASLRGTLLPGEMVEPASINAVLGNAVAISIAFWVRLSVEVYPGIRRSYVILPTALACHGLVLTWFLFTRMPYDRLALTLGFLLHVIWLYLVYVYADGRTKKRIAVVPFGEVRKLFLIEGISWVLMKRPRLNDVRSCDAIVADFSVDLPDEWEVLLADAALGGRIVFQHKQLSESLTGRVELEHLSENSFGSLMPSVGYFHLKSFIDLAFAVLLLPAAIPLMFLISLVIRVDSKGPVLFRQERIGHRAKIFTMYKFRTMRVGQADLERFAAMTLQDDERITKIGRVLRQLRLDELPQILNVIKGEMSWIGPRPEALALSSWYSSELPFYAYRHVVKPGISGWAQVNQGHVSEVDEVHRKLQYDFYYIKYFSPWLDALIILRTVKTIITGFGSK